MSLPKPIFYDIYVDRVKHNGAIVATLRRCHDNEFVDRRTFYGYSKRQSIEAMLKYHQLKHKNIALLIDNTK